MKNKKFAVALLYNNIIENEVNHILTNDVISALTEEDAVKMAKEQNSDLEDYEFIIACTIEIK